MIDYVNIHCTNESSEYLPSSISFSLLSLSLSLSPSLSLTYFSARSESLNHHYNEPHEVGVQQHHER